MDFFSLAEMSEMQDALFQNNDTSDDRIMSMVDQARKRHRTGVDTVALPDKIMPFDGNIPSWDGVAPNFCPGGFPFYSVTPANIYGTVPAYAKLYWVRSDGRIFRGYSNVSPDSGSFMHWAKGEANVGPKFTRLLDRAKNSKKPLTMQEVIHG